jgi:TPR repeat protein
MLRATLLALSLALSAPQVSADTFDDALSAYQSGDYLTAAKTFRKLAEQGNTYGQTSLGFMYENGQGVLQDYAEAVKWYRLAADQGVAAAQTCCRRTNQSRCHVQRRPRRFSRLRRSCKVVPACC